MFRNHKIILKLHKNWNVLSQNVGTNSIFALDINKLLLF